MSADTQNPSSLQAQEAFAAYQAVAKIEASNPALRENAFWQIIRAEAYANFAIALEAE